MHGSRRLIMLLLIMLLRSDSDGMRIHRLKEADLRPPSVATELAFCKFHDLTRGAASPRKDHEQRRGF